MAQWFEHQSAESEGLRFDSSRDSEFFLCPTLVTRRKKKNFFSIALPSSKLTISLISIYKHYAIDSADPSSKQDACHMNFVIDRAHRGGSVT